jgi:hypothetical protein
MNSDLLDRRYVKDLLFTNKYINNIIKTKTIDDYDTIHTQYKDNLKSINFHTNNSFLKTNVNNLYIPLATEVDLLRNKKIIIPNKQVKQLVFNNIFTETFNLLSKPYTKINFIIDNNTFTKDYDEKLNGESFAVLLLNFIQQELLLKQTYNNYEYINFIIKDLNTQAGYIFTIDKDFKRNKYLELLKIAKHINDSHSLPKDTILDTIPKDSKVLYSFIDKDAEEIPTGSNIFLDKESAVKNYIEDTLDISLDYHKTEGKYYTTIPRKEILNRFDSKSKLLVKVNVTKDILMKYPSLLTTDIQNGILQKSILDFEKVNSYFHDIDSNSHKTLIFQANEFTIEVESKTDTIVEDVIAFIKKKFNINEKAISLSNEEENVLNSIYFKVLDIKEKLIGENENIKERELLKLIKEQLETNEEIKGKLNELTASRIISLQQIERNKLILDLHDRQSKATVSIYGKETLIEDKIKEIQEKVLIPKKYNYTTLNEEMEYSTSNSFRTAYNKVMFEKDLFSMLTSFTDSEDIPIFVDHIDIEDYSSPKKRVDMLSVRFIMPNGRPQTMKMQIPKISHDGYMFLNGNKKLISNQVIALPITKIQSLGEDAVCFSTNYNKVFIARTNSPLSPRTAGFKDGISYLRKNNKLRGSGYDIRLGSAKEGNSDIITSLEYLELSKDIISLRVDFMNLFFSNVLIQKELERKNIDKINLKHLEKDYFIIGFEKDKIVLSDRNGVIFITDKLGKKVDKYSDNIIELIKNKFTTLPTIDFDSNKIFDSKSDSNKKYSYSSLRIGGIRIPVLMFLSYKDGLESVLNSYNVKYVFSKEKLNTKEYPNSIKFNDGYLMYDGTDIYKALLVNGLTDMKCDVNNFEDYNKAGLAYQSYFRDIGLVRFGKLLSNFYSLFIDPITEEVLKDHNLPTTLTESFLYCNTLLQSPSYSKKNDLSNYRIRNTEFINALLYKIVSKNIESFRKQGLSKHSTSSLTLPNNALLKELMDDPIVNDVPLLNPIREVENLAGTTFKGFGGSPFGHAKGTEEIRQFDKSFMGIFGSTTPDNGSVGISRKLSQNAMIKSIRGYLDIRENPELNATNVLSTGELLSPFTARHSDPPRQGMNLYQTTHVLSTNHMSKPLFTTGAHKTVARFTSSEFAFKAFDDGVVERIDKENNLVFLKYKDNSIGVIDTNVKSSRSPDGFYVPIHLTHNLKVGDKFKEGDILAADEYFFSLDGNETALYQGTLAKFALVPLHNTYEDSSVITEEFAEKMTSTIVMMTDITLTHNANIEYLVKVGDKVKTSDKLAIYEETFNDEDGYISKLLANMGSEFHDAVEAIGKNVKTSKYTGEIVDIRIYYTKPIEEYSESLQRLLKDYVGKHGELSKEFDKVRKDQLVDQRQIEPLEQADISGVKFEGIRIEIFIKMFDSISVGDKVSMSIALKTIVSSIIDKGYEPYSEHRDSQPISICLSPCSLVSRMTMDFFYHLYVGKILVETKELIREIYSN